MFSDIANSEDIQVKFIGQEDLSYFINNVSIDALNSTLSLEIFEPLHISLLSTINNMGLVNVEIHKSGGNVIKLACLIKTHKLEFTLHESINLVHKLTFVVM